MVSHLATDKPFTLNFHGNYHRHCQYAISTPVTLASLTSVGKGKTSTDFSSQYPGGAISTNGVALHNERGDSVHYECKSTSKAPVRWPAHQVPRSQLHGRWKQWRPWTVFGSSTRYWRGLCIGSRIHCSRWLFVVAEAIATKERLWAI